MKKILMAFSATMIVLSFIACNSNESKTHPIVKGEDSIVTADCPDCKDYSKEGFGGVPVSVARDMAKMYATNQYTRYTMNGGVQDSKSVWFSLDSIKKFIYNIEKAMCSCSGEMKNGLGVRIYFAAYPDANTLNTAPVSSYYSTVNQTFAEMHTLFMVPTYNTNNTDFDFDPWNLGKGGCEKPTTICERINSGDSAFLNGNILGLSPQASRGVKNHGNLCPPLCPEGASCLAGIQTELPDIKMKAKN
jgi:hypothetical protein